jgi:hypothetical protein
MAKEYIEREAVLKEIYAAQESLESNNDKEWSRNKPYFKGLAWANRIILDTPAADVVKVVRCEDCEFIHDPQYGIGYCYPEGSASYRVVSLDDFCKYGKRRDKE